MKFNLIKTLPILLLVAFIFPGIACAKVISKEIKYNDGSVKLHGFIAFDDTKKGKRPGVIVVHEWWGHNKHARRSAIRLAKLGYTALAVDMYGNGKTADHPKKAGEMSGVFDKDPALMKSRFYAALQLLKKQSNVDKDKIGAIGYCFGGRVVLEMAKAGVDLKVVASFHGSMPKPGKDSKKTTLKSAILVYHGEKDKFVKFTDIEAFKNSISTHIFQLKIYKTATHSFTNPDADKYAKKFKIPVAYDKVADNESWKHMTSQFKRLLK